MATNNSEFLKFAAEYLYKTLPQLTVYREDAPPVIQEQILQCMEAYPGLSMTLQDHPLDGGNESKGGKFLMFVLEGTIPITYQGGHYNIPVNVRLAGGYPQSPPVGYVKSSRELQLKQDHAHVDSLGFCHIKGFLAGQWDGSRTLKDFVDEMVRVFSAEPPLYSKPAPLAPSAPTSDVHATKAHAGNPADSAVVTLKDESVPIRRKTKSGAKKRPHGQPQVHHQPQQPVPNPPFPSQTKGAAKSVLSSEQPPSAPPAGGTGEGREKVLGPERPISEPGSDVSALSTQLSSLSTDDHKRGDAVKNVVGLVADLQDGKIATDRAAKVNEKIRQQRKEKEEDVSRWPERPDQNRQQIAQYPAAQGTSSSMPILHALSQDPSMPPQQQQQQQSMSPSVMAQAQQQVSGHPHAAPAPQQPQQQQQQQPPMSPYLQAQPNVPLSMQVPSMQALPSQQVSPHLQQRQQQQPSPAHAQPPPLTLPQTHQQMQQQQQQPTIPQRPQPQAVAPQGQQLQQPQSMPSHSQGLRVSPHPFPVMQVGNQPQPSQPRQYGPQPPRGVYLVGVHAPLQSQGTAGYMQDPRHSPQQYGQEPPRAQPHVQDQQPSTWPPHSQEQVQTLQAAQSRAVFQQRPVYAQDLQQAPQPGSQQRSPYMPEPPPQPMHLPDQQQQPQQPVPPSPTSAPAVSMPSQMQLPTGPRQRGAAPPPQQQRVLQQPMPSLGPTFSGTNDQSASPPISQPLPQYGPFLPHQYAQMAPQQTQPQMQPAASQAAQQGRPQPQQVQQRVSAGMPGRWSPAAVGVYSSQSMPIPPVPPPTSSPMFTHPIYPGQTPASPTASPVMASSSFSSAGAASPPLTNEQHMPQVTSPQATPVVMSPVTFQQPAPGAASSAASPYGVTLSQGAQPSGPPMYMHVPPSYSVSPSITYSPSGPNLYPAFVQSPRGSLAPYMPHMPGAQSGAYGTYNHNHTNLSQPYAPYNQPQPVGPLPPPTPPSSSMQPGHYAQYGSPYQPVWQQASPPYQGEGPRWG